MRITSILSNTFNSASKTRKKVDLTSFNGGNIQAQTTNAQKNVSFTGVSQQWSYTSRTPGTTGSYYIVSLQDGDNTVGSMETSNLADAVSYCISSHSMMYPNSTKESIGNIYSIGAKKRVYFTDPEEKVTEAIKKEHDYIIYDNRPIYPTPEEIKKGYLTPTYNRTPDFGTTFKNIGEYYYRLEMKDKKEFDSISTEHTIVQADYERSRAYKEELDEKVKNTPWSISSRMKKDKEVADYYYGINSRKMDQSNQEVSKHQKRIISAQEQQQKAIDAYKLFTEAAPTLHARDEAKSAYSDAENKLIETPEWIEQAKKTIAEEEQAKKDSQAECVKVEKGIAAIDAYLEYKELTSSTLSEKEKNQIKAEKADAENKLKRAKARIKRAEECIEEEKQNIENLITEAEKLKTTIPALKEKLDKKEAEARALYAKMEEFYQNNISKWQYTEE